MNFPLVKGKALPNLESMKLQNFPSLDAIFGQNLHKHATYKEGLTLPSLA